MNLKEAMKVLVNGGKVRMREWERGKYVMMTENGYVVDESGMSHPLMNGEYEEFDEEPDDLCERLRGILFEGKEYNINGRFYSVSKDMMNRPHLYVWNDKKQENVPASPFLTLLSVYNEVKEYKK